MEKSTTHKRMKERAATKPSVKRSLIITGRERLAIWERVRGIWKNRTPDPIKELEEMRKEWTRDLS